MDGAHESTVNPKMLQGLGAVKSRGNRIAEQWLAAWFLYFFQCAPFAEINCKVLGILLKSFSR
jgi:hypothetical protein